MSCSNLLFRNFWSRKIVKQASVMLACLFLASCQPSGRLSKLDSEATVLAFGDSLTFGTGVAAQESYPVVLAGLIGRTVIRSGRPGELSADGLVRLKSELKRTRPDLVVICHGGNDILRRKSAASTKQNLVAMIELVRSSGSEVILVAVPNLSLFPKAAGYYSELEDELGVPVEYEILSELQADSSKKSDAVHFNAAGYRELAGAIAEQLASEGAI